MKKRLLCLILVCCLLSSMLPFSVSAAEIVDSGTCGANLTWTLDTDGVLTISGTGEMYNYEYSGSGGPPWHDYAHNKIQEIVIQEGITHIGDRAFNNCQSLLRVTMPASVSSIGENAFYHCPSLEEAVIPDGVVSIGNSAFYGAALQNVVIPDSVTDIGYSVFHSNSSLKRVTIGNGLSKIGSEMFQDCSNLVSVNLGENITEIDFNAFSRCGSLAQIELPETLEEIGTQAFEDCVSLTSVTIPSSVSEIGSGAYSGCTSLTAFTVSAGNETYYASDGVLFEKTSYQTKLCAYPAGKKDAAYNVPTDVTAIESYAFQGSVLLTKVNIPSSVSSIYSAVFSHCDNLSEISVDAENKRYSSKNGVLYNKEFTELICCPGGLSGDYEVANTVQTISSYAFEGCAKLQRVLIPDSVTNIGFWAFHDCSSLRQVNIPNGVEKLNGTFLGCESLKEISIPDSVTDIGHFAFDGCKSLTSVVIPDSVVELGDYSFMECTSLERVVIGQNVTEIGLWAFQKCENLKEVSIGRSVSRIGDLAFQFCGSLTSIIIPDSVTDIGWLAFSGCANLEHVKFGSNVAQIGESAFSACYSLISIAIPDSVSELGDGAFGYCSNLTNVSIGNGISNIGENTFAGCRQLTNLIMPANVVEIGYRAFYNCSNLSDVYYYGSESQFSSISMAEFNNNLLAAQLHTVSDGSYAVLYNPLGGMLDNSLKFVQNGGQYGDLPSAVRNGYAFEGWYTEPDGGSQIKPSTTVSLTEAQALYAHWAMGADTHNVTFDPGAGTLATNTMAFTNGDKYGELPTPIRSGYTFDGWYTAPGSFTYEEEMASIALAGTKVTDITTVSLASDVTLYAHWMPNADEVALSDLTYSFTNTRAGFEYDRTYKIPFSRYEAIFGAGSDFASKTFNAVKSWFGNCYGISATTSMMFQRNNGISADLFNNSAAHPQQLRLHDYSDQMDMDLLTFIETMQISQYSPSIARIREVNLNQIRKLCADVTYFQNTGLNPVVVSVRGKSTKGSGGHAIVAYKLEQISETEDHLLVYDSNHPNDASCYITLQKNGAGAYTNEWYYEPLDWGSMKYVGADRAGNISYYPYGAFYNVWQNRGTVANSVEEVDSFETTSTKMENMELLTVNVNEASIYDSKNDLAATIRNGELRTFQSDIYILDDVGITGDGAAEENGISIWLPIGDYTLVNDDSSVSSFEVSMAHNKQSATVATAAKRIIFHVNDRELLNCVQISEHNQEFSINLSSTIPDSKASVQVSGTTGDTMFTVMQYDGDVRLGGIDSASNLRVIIDGETVSADSLLGTIPSFASGASGDSLSTSELTFTDVSDSAYYFDAVKWAFENGITTGKTETMFGPFDNCTRGQVVTFLWRAMGQPEPTSMNNPFTDVKDSDYYYKAVLWAIEEGITNGTSATVFSPDQTCSRAHIVTFLYRNMGEPGKTGTGDWWADAANWANANGLFEGTGITFTSGADCPRGDVVYYLWRVLE